MRYTPKLYDKILLLDHNSGYIGYAIERGRMIIGPCQLTESPSSDGLSVSWHGLKLSPMVGEWMAQLILTGTKPDDMQHFAFERFGQGKEIQPRNPSGVLG